ncbi:hypothetical protein Za10_1166 [Zymomonas mobilis subsp. mobilis NCIMB 11163]|uniref:hypothetical protein n=2 Tax=Zymomonas mobilis TaxID=542 RepID=UPI0001B70572|nr:hypothetical protein [Zymomonas mobilis]ACV75710.1 hypothetical protein Za10_1166 [Zymomonas mobilis subsp. mobilis NCIMB 11163]
MAENSLFTVLTTLFSGASGAGLTYLFNFLSEKRRIKFDEKKEQRAEKERLNKKSIMFLNKINKYHNLMIDLHDHFNKPILETQWGYMQALSDIKAIITPHEQIIISDDDNYDIFRMSGEKAFNAANRLDDKINSTILSLDLYNEKYLLLKDPQKNKNQLIEIVSIAKSIATDSKKNIEDIKQFLIVFVNGDNFYAKNIEIELPKIGGGFETIKRTVP